MAAASDVPMRIVSPSAAAERRITPSWSVAQLKAKLEPVTGIPPSGQKLILKVPGMDPVSLEAADEEKVQLSEWNLVAQAEIEV